MTFRYKFYGDRPREPLGRGIKHKGIAEYSDFGPIERYISDFHEG